MEKMMKKGPKNEGQNFLEKMQKKNVENGQKN